MPGLLQRIRLTVMNKRTKIALGIGGIALIIAAAGGGYYYFGSRTQTPEYALKTIEKSLTEHNKTEFYKFVDIDGVLNTGYDGFVEGLTGTSPAITPEAADAVREFTQVLRAPLILSMKSAVDYYVESGNFNKSEDTGLTEIFSRIGIDTLEFRSIENIQTDPEDEGLATAEIRIFQPEINREFSLQTILAKNEDGRWQVTGIKNFQEFIALINVSRREKLDEYLTKTSEISLRHDSTIREAEQKYSEILAPGSLGKDTTRAELKKIMTEVIKKDWEVRKQELFGVTVPKGAETLHNLRLKICDLYIEYAEDYANWLDDKKAATIKSAEEKRRRAQILTTEASAIARRMTN